MLAIEAHPGTRYPSLTTGPNQSFLNYTSHHVGQPTGKVSFVTMCGFCLYRLLLSLSSPDVLQVFS